MVKLADTLDLGSSAIACRFKSCHPYQKIRRHFAVFLFLSVDGLATICNCRQTVFATCTCAADRKQRETQARSICGNRAQRTCRNSGVGKFICKTKRQSVKRSSPCIARKQYQLFNLRWERKSTLIECAFW